VLRDRPGLWKGGGTVTDETRVLRLTGRQVADALLDAHGQEAVQELRSKGYDRTTYWVDVVRSPTEGGFVALLHVRGQHTEAS